MSSGEAEYIYAAVACMRASYLRILINDMRFDNEATICMAKCDKDTAGNRHVARRYHYVQQGTALQEHNIEWIGIKYQLADPLTKTGSAKSFFELWKHIVHNCMD